jgi:hypothetical protein
MNKDPLWLCLILIDIVATVQGKIRESIPSEPGIF